MPSRHFYISSIVSVLVAVVFFALIAHESKFRLNEEFQIIPDGFVLPQGCDIKIDMQTGETWARISNNSVKVDRKNLIAIENDSKKSGSAVKTPPSYKNVTKSRIQARLSPEVQLKVDESLLDLESNENWDFLFEEAPAMEFGLAILESKYLSKLFAFENVARSLKLISTCLQNNPLAVDRLLEVSDDVVGLLQKFDDLTVLQMKFVLRIIESVMNNSEAKSNEKFISAMKQALRNQLEHLDGLDERHEQLRQALLQ